MKYVLIGFVRLWRALISPLYGDVCKYYPSCSSYGLEALRLHGAIRGSYLTVRRLGRCHPWSDGGFDPVPGSTLEAKLRAEGVRLYADSKNTGAKKTTRHAFAGWRDSASRWPVITRLSDGGSAIHLPCEVN